MAAAVAVQEAVVMMDVVAMTMKAAVQVVAVINYIKNNLKMDSGKNGIHFFNFIFKKSYLCKN
jgi:hypothetical protein